MPCREYVVAVAFDKAVPDPAHRATMRDAVLRVHQCTRSATELLNLYVRDRIENHAVTGLDQIFDANWLNKVYSTVSYANGKASTDPNVQTVFDAHMATNTTKVARTGLTQALLYEGINLAAVGSTNIWMHFHKRVLAYTRTQHALDEAAYTALSKEQRRARKLAMMQMADDVCRPPTEALRSPADYHEWVVEQRALLRIDAAIGKWTNSKGETLPLLYHLKANPHRFLAAMHTMSLARVAAGKRAFALFPLRRSHVPGHMRFDKRVIDDLLKLGCHSAAMKARAAAKTSKGRAKKRKADDPSLLAEKAKVFNQVLDLRAAKLHRKHHFAFAFTTDGVSLHLNMQRPGKDDDEAGSKKKKRKVEKTAPLSAIPTRGIHSIDALKATLKPNLKSETQLHTVGIDPGKRELIVAVDGDDPRNAPVQRYTLAQRRRDLRTGQYEAAVRNTKPVSVAAAETALSLLDSKAPSLAGFAAFAAERRRCMAECPELRAFYQELDHRHRRRKRKIKTQQSEARLFKRLHSMHKPGDGRQLVLAYGAWGLVAGRPGMACNKGNPPAVGVGLMKRLAKEFLVVPTPEQYTSKTCAACGGLCGPHATLKTKTNKDIRGLRVCQNEGCGLLFNRDKLGARNIATQFDRLCKGLGPIKVLTDEELEFHRLNVCIECVD
jgi:hypothetical protein